MPAKTQTASDPVSPEEGGMTYWDKVALTRWGSYLTERERGLVLQGIQSAGKPALGIDMGCGSGRWSKLASESGWRMTCIDADQQSLSVCQRNLPQANCLLANPAVHAIPCQSNSAALLLCVEVAPVIDADWFPSEASRVLADGGVLVAVAWNRHSWRGLALRLKYRLAGTRDTGRFYSHPYSRLKERLTAAGFQVLYEEGLCWGPLGRTSNSALVPLFVTLERVLRLNRWVAWSPWVAFIARKTMNGDARTAIGKDAKV